MLVALFIFAFGNAGVCALGKQNIFNSGALPYGDSTVPGSKGLKKDTLAQPFICYPAMPEFPGGTTALFKYLGDHIKYPKASRRKGHEGTVFVRFTVNKDGSLTNFVIRKAKIFRIDSIPIFDDTKKNLLGTKIVNTEIKEGDRLIEHAAIEALKAMPKWIPTKRDGKLVAVEFVVPIKFKLD